MTLQNTHLRLAECESKIYNGIKGFYEAGKALLEIREERLYKDAGHETFEEYCLTKWKFTRTYAKNLMNAYSVVKELEESFDKNETIVSFSGKDKEGEVCQTIDFKSLPVMPVSESQVRPLAKIKDPEIRKQVWEDVVKKSEEEERPITAKDVEREVSKYCEPCDTYMQYRVITYLNQHYLKKFNDQKRGEQMADFARKIIEHYLDNPTLLK